MDGGKVTLSVPQKSMDNACDIDEATDNLATVVDVVEHGLQGVWDIDGGEDAFVQPQTVGCSFGIAVGAHHLTTVIDAQELRSRGISHIHVDDGDGSLVQHET